MKLPKITLNRYYVLYSLVFIYLVYPGWFACRYFDYLRSDEILDSLIRKTTHNLSEYQHKGIQCDYSELVEENLLFYKPPYTSETLNKVVIKSGGEYTPEDCSPSFSTAIIVPYRDRDSQLKQFLIYMHNYLRRQQIHYRIFIIEQEDSKPFNRAKLFNIGASIAMKHDYPCLILQDVDLMPMRLGNIYACSKRPRHMSSSLDLFRYNLPYYGLFGGAVAISSETFLNVNGFSNMFQGWGGEDDDLYARMLYHHYRICRFDPQYSQYTMLKHSKEKPNSEAKVLLKNGKLRFNTDGLNSLVYKEVATTMHSLFTHVLVET